MHSTGSEPVRSIMVSEKIGDNEWDIDYWIR
jgi:hypothetical protein